MRCLVIASVLVLAAGTCAFAAAYDDFSRGLSANNIGDSDAAIASFTAALAGDLTPGLVPQAHYGLSKAYYGKGDCQKALPEADKALAARPDYPDAQLMRGYVNACLGRFDEAIADYSKLVVTRPGEALSRARGFLRWRMGDFAGAAADYAQAVTFNRKNAYDLLWRALNEARAGKTDATALKDGLDNIDSDWPAPAIELFAGKATPADVENEAARGEPRIVVNQQCEAAFYLAEWYLGRSDPASARVLLDKAVAGCPHDFVEYGSAKAERARLDQGRS